MNRTQKSELVRELEERIQSSTVALVARYDRLTVAQVDRLRRDVRAAKGECKVAKNTLLRRAFASTSYQGTDRIFEGTSFFVFGNDDPIAVTKVFAKWAESENDKFAIKGGFFEGSVLGPAAVVELARTPSKDVLRAKLLGTLQAPAATLVRLLAEPGSQVARLLAAREKAL